MVQLIYRIALKLYRDGLLHFFGLLTTIEEFHLIGCRQQNTIQKVGQCKIESNANNSRCMA